MQHRRPGSPSWQHQTPGDAGDASSVKEDADRRTRGLGGLAVTLALLVIGLVLVRHLMAQSAIEDCLMQGRADCVPIDGADSTAPAQR